MSKKSPLPSGKITWDEVIFMIILIPVGGLIGSILIGFLTSCFGRKNVIILLTIPQIVGWLLILFAQNVNYLNGAQILLGIVGGGIFVTIPQFLSEIAADR